MKLAEAVDFLSAGGRCPSDATCVYVFVGKMRALFRHAGAAQCE